MPHSLAENAPSGSEICFALHPDGQSLHHPLLAGGFLYVSAASSFRANKVRVMYISPFPCLFGLKGVVAAPRRTTERLVTRQLYHIRSHAGTRKPVVPGSRDQGRFASARRKGKIVDDNAHSALVALITP